MKVYICKAEETWRYPVGLRSAQLPISSHGAGVGGNGAPKQWSNEDDT
ncbi:hypothetical protein L195_g062015, partial [Trifolium pratense]